MNQQQFIENINNLKEYAKGTGNRVTMEDIKREFAGEELAGEQLNMIMEFFNVSEEENEEQVSISQEKLDELAREDERFLKEYEYDLRETYPGIRLFKEVDEKTFDIGLDKVLAVVLNTAMEYKLQGIALADLTQEGNLVAFELIKQKNDFSCEELKEKLALCFDNMVQGQSRQNSDELKTLARVNKIQETADRLYEELGRKVTLEEIAAELSWSVEEVKDLSKYTDDNLENVSYKSLEK